MRKMTWRPIQRARWLVALAVLVAIVLWAPGSAAAAAPFEVSGTATTTSSVVSNERTVGAVTFFDLTEQDSVSGGLSGTSVFEFSCQVAPNGQGTCHGTQTFTGTVAGESGTVRFSEEVFFVVGEPSHGSFTAVGGTGGLANLRGHGTFEAASGHGTYSAQLVFVP
jgi:hypothetical protein